MNLALKRTLDIAVSALALVLLSPLLLAVTILIAVTSGFPVLFRQQRPGLHGKPFNMFKFRTMTDRTDKSGNVLSDAARLTALGRFLRATSADELPELLNVLRGDMSLVGPRPLLIRYLQRYTPEQARRHEVKPGITGWAQINGRNAISWEEKFRLDVWYVDNRSLWLDIGILSITVWKVLSRQGISADCHATMPEFTGQDTDSSRDPDPIPWLEILECISCRGPLKPSAEGLTCLRCQREYGRNGKTFSVLPNDVPSGGDIETSQKKSWRTRFVGAVYTRHNRTRRVARPLEGALGSLSQDDWGLCVGSSDSKRLHPRMLNLDIKLGHNVDIQGTAEDLPFADESLKCVVSQEVFEHLPAPDAAIREVHRVLKPGGVCFLQVPFLIGVHGAPHDYWRFSYYGLKQFVESVGFAVDQAGPTVGAGTSAYRVCVELAATAFASLWRGFYLPAKAVSAVLCAPLRWLDAITTLDPKYNRIPGGHYVICRKHTGAEP